MALAFDAGCRFPNDAATTSGASPTTWTHTPVGTPKAVIVAANHAVSTTDDDISGITYGGVALTRVGRVRGTTAEDQVIYLYFLGSGIPTGAQTISVTRVFARQLKFWAVTLTGAGDTSVDSSNSGPDTVSVNPLLVVTHSGSLTGAFGVVVHAYGGTVPPNQTGSSSIRPNMTVLYDMDFGTLSSEIYYTTAGASGTSTVFGYTTLASDDQLLFAMVVKEAAAAASRPQQARRVAPRPAPPSGGVYS